MGKKIIIIYEQAGGGHRQLALTLKGILSQNDVQASLMTPLEFLGYPVKNVFSTILLTYLRIWDIPWLVDFLFCYVLRIFLQPWLIGFGVRRFVRATEKHRPDVLISTISGLNTTFQYSAEKLDIPCYIFISDIAVYADVLARNATHLCYFQETAAAVSNFPAVTFCCQPIGNYDNLLGKFRYPILFGWHHGLRRKPFFRSIQGDLPNHNNLACRAVGILREKAFYESVNLDPGELRKKLGIPPDKPSVLVTSGSLGGKFIVKTLKSLFAYAERPLTIIPLCGKDEKLFRRVSRMQEKASGDLTLLPLRYTENIDEFLRAADAVITRGTCGIFLEAILTRTPLISRRQVEKYDSGANAILEKYSLGLTYDNGRELTRALDQILARRGEYAVNMEQLVRQIGANDYGQLEANIKGIILDEPEK